VFWLDRRRLQNDLYNVLIGMLDPTYSVTAATWLICTGTLLKSGLLLFGTLDVFPVTQLVHQTGTSEVYITALHYSHTTQNKQTAYSEASIHKVLKYPISCLWLLQ